MGVVWVHLSAAVFWLRAVLASLKQRHRHGIQMVVESRIFWGLINVAAVGSQTGGPRGRGAGP